MRHSGDFIISKVSSFASVKLPGRLVDTAREAAQSMRRSVASQIEYWATLGRVVEHSGLTVQAARDAIEHYEATARKTRLKARLDDIDAHFAATKKSGSLAQRVREVVLGNRAKAVVRNRKSLKAVTAT